MNSPGFFQDIGLMHPGTAVRRILFVITGLDYGGAETQVCNLALRFKARGLSVGVVSMLPPVAYRDDLARAGIELWSLNMRRKRPDFRMVWRLVGIVRPFKPDIVHSHMIHASLLRPRVLMVGTDYPGGHGQYCRALCSALRSSGLDVRRINYLPMSTSRLMRWKPLWLLDRGMRSSVNTVKAIASVLVHRPDVVHFQLLLPAVDRWWIPILARHTSCVVTVHNVSGHQSVWAGRPRDVTEIYQSVSALIVHSGANEQQLLEAYPVCHGKTVVIRHAAWEPLACPPRDDIRRELGWDPHEFRVLLFGGLRQDKGIDVALHTLHILATSRTAGYQMPRFVFAGAATKDFPEELFRQLVNAAGVSDYVQRVPLFIPDSLMARMFSAADILLLPYTPEFKAQSGVLLMAYAYGLPVVVTDVGALGDTVRMDHTGWVVQPGDSAALAAAVVEAAAQPAARNKYSEEMRRLAATRYSWSTMTRDTAKVYRDVWSSLKAGRRRE